jgi:hypothetical protein
MQHPPSSDYDRPPFDSAFALELIGKYVLVGVTVEDRRGETRRQEQFHGIVVAANAVSGINLVLRGTRDGERKWLPPATHVFSAAPRGTYSLRATNETVVDPDYTSQWVLVQSDA